MANLRGRRTLTGSRRRCPQGWGDGVGESVDDFPAQHGHVLGRREAEANSAAVDFPDGDVDALVDDDLFADAPRENEHDDPSVVS
jgi:hypothetical protein